MDLYAVRAVDKNSYNRVFAVWASSAEDAMEKVNAFHADRPMKTRAEGAKKISLVCDGTIQELFDDWND